MKKIIIGVTIFLLQLTISTATSVGMTVEDIEAESVEGIAPASIEIEKEMNQASNDRYKKSRSRSSEGELEDKNNLEMVNGIVQRKIKIDNDAVIAGEDDVEHAKNVEPASDIEI